MSISSFILRKRYNVSSILYSVSKKSKTRKLFNYFATDASDNVNRIGRASAFPNEQPGQNYDFNWALNFDGVTPLKNSAFRITKSLDMKVAGLTPWGKSPLKVNATSEKENMLEAGSDNLSYETFDEVSKRTKKLLSLSEHLYCTEGYVPGTRKTARIISNSEVLTPKLLSYLERSPKKYPSLQPITAYVLEGVNENFLGYAIEEIVDKVIGREKSVAAVVVACDKPSIECVVAGLELSVNTLLKDDAVRSETINTTECI